MSIESRWQPIETVPKDGCEVDLWCINISRGSDGAARFPGMSWDGQRWEDWRYILESKWRPTHWMPIPAPPEQVEKMAKKDIGQMDEKEIPGRLEYFNGRLREVKDATRSGWWRFNEHYDRDGYCDNPGRGY